MEERDSSTAFAFHGIMVMDLIDPAFDLYIQKRRYYNGTTRLLVVSYEVILTNAGMNGIANMIPETASCFHVIKKNSFRSSFFLIGDHTSLSGSSRIARTSGRFTKSGLMNVVRISNSRICSTQ